LDLELQLQLWNFGARTNILALEGHLQPINDQAFAKDFFKLYLDD